MSGPATGPTQPIELEGPVPPAPRRRPALRATVGLGVGYAVTAALSLAVGALPGSLSPVWFADALGVAHLASRSPREWPGPLMVLAPVCALAYRMGGADGSFALHSAWLHLAAMLLGAALLRRFGLHQSTLRSPIALLRVWAVGAVLPQLAAAVLGALLWMPVAEAGLRPPLLQRLQGWTIGSLAMLPVALQFYRSGWVPFARALGDWRNVALSALALAVAVLSLGYAAYPFVCIVLPLIALALAADLAAVGLATVAMALAMALTLGLGIFVPQPAASAWQSASVYLAFAATLAPGLLLAAALAELHDSAERLHRHSQALRRSNEALEQFVHIASHDLREPLNTVRQFGGLLESDHARQLAPQGRHYLDLVCRAAMRMQTLLDDVLEYARLQGADPVSPEPVPLEPLVAEVADSLAAHLHQAGGTLRAGRLPVVPGDAALLALLMRNLVSNAIKFVPPGGVPRVEVSARSDDTQAWITVADNGIGIDAADLPKLFRPFQRLNLRRHYEGTGLGLALCRQVAQMHGGEIQVESVPGKGSCFTVRLPLARPGPGAAPRASDH